MKRICSFRFFILIFVPLGCNMLDSPTIPDGSISPTIYHSKEGGLALYHGAVGLFRDLAMKSTLEGGLLTDELNALDIENRSSVEIDSRSEVLTKSGEGEFHKLRGQAQLARAVLARYATDLSPALRGRLFAIEGYAVLFLGDQYCSGLSLSTLHFDGDYTYGPSLSLPEVYDAAAILFDSALAISSDSIELMTLSKIGKARSLIARGNIDEALAISKLIRTEERYAIPYSFKYQEGVESDSFARKASVSDREGINGLPFITSNDPRTPSDFKTVSIGSKWPARKMYYPRKFVGDSFSFVLATGVEARLIEAEYLLAKNRVSEWLSMLNELRNDGTYVEINIEEESLVDTLWNPGLGKVAHLPPLKDPGNSESRITLMFNERAYWLYLSGHRLPDLRRLVRQYGRDAESVFPTGPYTYSNAADAYYGTAVNMEISSNESPNRLSQGCIGRDQ